MTLTSDSGECLLAFIRKQLAVAGVLNLIGTQACRYVGKVRTY
jgi:hypothetical protein